MIKVHIKTNGNVFILGVERIFTDSIEDDKAVLHFAAEKPFKELLDLSLENRWELYRYPSDNHVGLFVPMSDIFRVFYED